VFLNQWFDNIDSEVDAAEIPSGGLKEGTELLRADHYGI